MVKTKAIALLITLSVFQTAFAETTAPPKTTEPPAEIKQKLKWYDSYEKGMALAKAQKRPALISFHASWCGWCEKMDAYVFADPKIVEKLRDFVCIKVDVDRNRSVAFAYGVQSLPRVVVVNVTGEMVGDWLGFRDAEQFTELLGYVSEYLYKSSGAMKAPEIPLYKSKPQAEVPEVKVNAADVNELADLLGHRDPAVRTKVIEMLVQKGPEVLAYVVPALESKYLGTRIAAWKVIKKLKITNAKFEPWAPAEERATAIGKLKKQLGPLKIKPTKPKRQPGEKFVGPLPRPSRETEKLM